MKLTEKDLCALRDAMTTDSLAEALKNTEAVILEIMVLEREGKDD